MERWRVDGRFLRLGSERAFLRLVTYGPFPPSRETRWPNDFRRIRAAGFDAVRLYEWPVPALLDAAAACGLRVFAMPEWPMAVDFRDGEALAEARSRLAGGLAASGGHPALAGVFVANEIPGDLARWMGPEWTRIQIEGLIRFGRDRAPDLIWAYGNYPTTEYLEPGNADVTAMNVYLEDEAALRGYLARLHHIAGDRPVLVSEFGADSRRLGPEGQARLLSGATRATADAGMAGFCVFAWSDSWWTGGAEVENWDFGMIDRAGRPKPVLVAVKESLDEPVAAAPETRFSVIVCTRNGRGRIGGCLRALRELRGMPYEVVVVDDGSDDGTGDYVEAAFPEAKLLRLEPGGLSAARNAGAEAATGEVLAFTDDDCEPDADWLVELSRVLAEGWSAVGGPNLAPEPQDTRAAVVAAAPGAASHVMIDDREAEHVPGCNLAVRAEAFHAIGGFDVRFHTAGDDVDFCWRLRDAGMRIGFAPNAWVWHHRRPCLVGYLRQQVGYGRAEAMLMVKHPRRFSPTGDALWHGVIYTGAPVRAAGSASIYHGPMGLAGYQGVVARTQPLRDLEGGFDTPWARLLLGVIGWLAPRMRAKVRTGRFIGPVRDRPVSERAADHELAFWDSRPREVVLRDWLAAGWTAGGVDDDWDLEKDGTRVLIACERHGQGVTRVLVRVWGDAEVVSPFCAAEDDPPSPW